MNSATLTMSVPEVASISNPDKNSPKPLSWDELSKIVSDRGYQPVDLANGPTNS